MSISQLRISRSGILRESMGVAIRRGSAADAPAAAALYIRARRAAAEAGTIPPGIHDEEDVAGYLAARELWLAGGDGLLVLEDDWGAQLYVAPGREGHGIGSAPPPGAQGGGPPPPRPW